MSQFSPLYYLFHQFYLFASRAGSLQSSVLPEVHCQVFACWPPFRNGDGLLDTYPPRGGGPGPGPGGAPGAPRGAGGAGPRPGGPRGPPAGPRLRAWVYENMYIFIMFLY